MNSLSTSIFLRETGQLGIGEFNFLHSYHHLKMLDHKANTREKFTDSLIMEIIPTQILLFAITSSWKCLCIHKNTFKLHLELTAPGERSRTIFYNKHQESMILVFLQEVQGDERLTCKSFRIIDLERGILKGNELFPREDLRTPGFLEFDDINRLIMTKSAATREFKFWKLQDYSLLYTIADPLVEEVRLTTEVCLLVHSPQENFVMCKLCSVVNGTLLDAYEISLKPHRVIELLELFGSFLLLKQYGEPLVIINLLTHTRISIPGFISPQNFIYLHEKQIFLALRSCVIEVWNFSGKLLKIYHAPIYSGNGGYIPSRLYISKVQDMIMLTCIERTRPLGRSIAETLQKSVIKIFKLFEGDLIKEIKNLEFLENLSTLTYDESFGNIYTGHADGSITWFTN